MNLPRKHIIQANLCLRFYTSAGWTREDVRQLLSADQRLERVVPRYFDERDYAIRNSSSNEHHDTLPHDDCAYFAVYGCMEPFSREALSKHEIV